MSDDPHDAALPAPGKPARWEIVYHRDNGVASWTWRLMRADGTIERTSEPHANFGKAMNDAMRNGFSPKRDFWVIKRQKWITSFDRGQVISTGPRDEVIQRASAPAPSLSEVPLKQKG